MIIHAADVPTSQYENVMKTDAIDSEKLAKIFKRRIVERNIHQGKKKSWMTVALSGCVKLYRNNLGDINHV